MPHYCIGDTNHTFFLCHFTFDTDPYLLPIIDYCRCKRLYLFWLNPDIRKNIKIVLLSTFGCWGLNDLQMSLITKVDFDRFVSWRLLINVSQNISLLFIFHSCKMLIFSYFIALLQSINHSPALSVYYALPPTLPPTLPSPSHPN